MRILLAIVIILTFFLINLGGHVHNTHSSLACPDWPLCFGQFMPVMEKGVLIEHSHRLLASLVGLLTILIAYLSRNLTIKKVTFVSVIMVIIQGVLGGLTVIFKLPPLISTAHLGLAMVFLCTLIYLHHELKPVHQYTKGFYLTRWALGILFFQIMAGAFIRHVGAGTACGFGKENMIFCLGAWLPDNLQQFFHLGHRSLGLVTGIILVIVSFDQLRKKKIFFALSLLSLLLVQIWLGTEIIATAFRPIFTLLHLTGATLMLAVTFKVFLLEKTSEKKLKLD